MALKNSFLTFLSIQRNQRIINGLIAVVIIILLVSNLNYVKRSSGIRIHQKFDLLSIIAIIYLVQTIFNKVWLNWTLKIVYSLIIAYIVFSFVYVFFDKYEPMLKKEYGVFFKTIGTTVKLTIGLIALWLTHKLKPNGVNVDTTNTRYDTTARFIP